MLGWLLTAVLLAQPAPADTAPVPPAVARLIRQLDSPDQAERDEAEQRLLALGPAVLPHLAIPPRASNEVRVRLRHLRGVLQKAAAENAVRPALVTLAARDEPVLDLLAAIAEQTGNPVEDLRQRFGQQGRNPRLSLAVEKTSWWQAVDGLLDEAELGVYPFAGNGKLALVNRGEDELPRRPRAAYAGAFRLEASDVVAQRDPRRRDGHALQLAVQIAWEPRLAPLAIKLKPEECAAWDDQGQPLRLPGAGTTLEVQVVPQAGASELRLAVAPPERKAARISRFRGRCYALLPAAVEEFRFEDLDRFATLDRSFREQRQAEATVILDRVRKNRALWQIEMRVRFDSSSGALESHRTWISENAAWLVAADGKKIERAAFESLGQDETQFAAAFLFELPGGIAGHAFVYRTPTILLLLPIDFELHDIPLP